MQPVNLSSPGLDATDPDQVLCHCDLEVLQELVRKLESAHQVQIVRSPSVCLTMIRAEDSLESQQFYLGEALSTECEVTVDGVTGFGVCLGEEISRSYCMAVVDALREGGAEAGLLTAFFTQQGELLEERDRREFGQVLRTKVDFKLLEQE